MREPIEWKDFGVGDNPLGSDGKLQGRSAYQILRLRENEFHLLVSDGADALVEEGVYPTLQAAKAAAEDHYSRTPEEKNETLTEVETIIAKAAARMMIMEVALRDISRSHDSLGSWKDACQLRQRYAREALRAAKKVEGVKGMTEADVKDLRKDMGKDDVKEMVKNMRRDVGDHELKIEKDREVRLRDISDLEDLPEDAPWAVMYRTEEAVEMYLGMITEEELIPTLKRFRECLSDLIITHGKKGEG